jgi:phosphomannomutase
MHGVGYKPVKRAFDAAGFTEVHVVPSQTEPDGTFPTVSFPNPEEKGALDQALALAREHDAELILANDPDADRLAVCVPGYGAQRGSWRQLSGNQIGLILADHLLRNYKRMEQPLVACSIVSSPMLAKIAEHYHAMHTETFTGFKWVWNAALELREQHNVHFVFGFEEAIGYSAEDIVRDKDGISTALLFAELAASLSAQGSSVLDRLGELYREYGLWVSYQRSITRPGTAGQAEIAAGMKNLAENSPKEFDGNVITRFINYNDGGADRPRWLKNDNLLSYSLGDLGRVLVRPSGTEPKIKIYVDLTRPLSAGEDWQQREGELMVEAGRLADAVSRVAGFAG